LKIKTHPAPQDISKKSGFPNSGMQQQLIGNAHEIIEVADLQNVQMSWKKYEELNNLKVCGCRKIKILKNGEAASCREVSNVSLQCYFPGGKSCFVYIWQKERAFSSIVQHYRLERGRYFLGPSLQIVNLCNACMTSSIRASRKHQAAAYQSLA
jgi:hypothetical protein